MLLVEVSSQAPLWRREYHKIPSVFPNGRMHASPQFLFQSPQLGLLPPAHRLSQDREVPLPGPSANVRETQEVERLRLTFATLARIARAVPSETALLHDHVGIPPQNHQQN
jgi:hypothetical protein